MATPRVWVLNLDAERELERPGATTADAATRARIAALRPRLAALLGPDDLILDDDPPRQLTAGRPGLAWCPTPDALRRLRAAGATPPPAPPLATLRQANHRRFCASLGQGLPGARYVDCMEDLESTVALPCPTGHWLLKRPLGFAGRGRLRVARGPLPPDAARWAVASLRGGDGLQVEPEVPRLGDYAIHGLLAPDGAVTLGTPTAQRCSPQGAWERTEPAGNDLLDSERACLLDEARRTAHALQALGYFGPFNLDAFAWESEGRRVFLPRCEINARYSMGWAIGMASPGAPQAVAPPAT